MQSKTIFRFLPMMGILLTLLLSFWIPVLSQSSDERLIFEERFEHGLNHWKVEDRGKHHLIELTNGELHISNRTETPGVFVWNTTPLPESYRLEFDFTPLGRGSKNEGFFLLFLGAKGLNDISIFDDSLWSSSELVDFRKYTRGSIRCYHIGYLRGETGLCNLRKNPGLKLVKSSRVPALREGSKYHIVVKKKDARITMRVTGPGIDPNHQVFQDWTDPAQEGPVLNGGHFGFRQIAYDKAVKGAYDNVKLFDLNP
jgi:hypothetical protein